MNFRTLLQATVCTLLLQFLLLPTANSQFEFRSAVGKSHYSSEPKGIIQVESDRTLPPLQILWTLTNKHR